MRFPLPAFLAALLLPLLSHLATAQTTDSLTAVKSRYSLLRPVPRNLMRPLSADRPGVTESPFTVDAGHLQFETDLARHISSKPGAEMRQRTIRANAFVLKMGLSNRTDVQLFLDAYEWNRTFATATEPATRNQGFGDVTLRVKHNLSGNDSTESALALAFIGFVRLPTGGQQGAGGAEYGLLLPATYALNDSWNLSAQLPISLHFDRDEAATLPRNSPLHQPRPFLSPLAHGFRGGRGPARFPHPPLGGSRERRAHFLRGQKHPARFRPPLRPHPRGRPGVFRGLCDSAVGFLVVGCQLSVVSCQLKERHPEQSEGSSHVETSR